MSMISDYALSVLIACLLVLLVITIKRKFNYFSNRGLPYVKPTLLSTLKSFTPWYIINSPYKIYNDGKDGDNSVMGYFQTFVSPMLLVMDPSMVQNILIKDFSHFQDHGTNIDFSRDPLVGHLFNMEGDPWRALRNKLLPTFTSGKLKGMIPSMESCAQTVIKDMKEDDSLRQDINLKNLAKRFTVAVIASCAFGIDPDSVKDPDCEYQQVVRTVLSPPLRDQIKQIIMFSSPTVAKFLKLKFVPRHVDEYFINLTRETMQMRKRSGIKRNDFIQLLMELKEKGSVQVDHRDLEEDEKDLMKQQQLESESVNKLEMTYEVLAAQVFVFIAAGFDNTAYLVALTTYLLSKNKDIEKRVREEVRTAKGKHGGLNYEALKDMKLLDASMNEALRMYPPIFFLIRECTKSYSLNNGTTIDKGCRILIPAKSLQNDSRYWRNPEQFNPDRFFNDDIIPGTYMPFGDGPRLCIAQRLALLMGKVMMAELIDNFDLLPSNMTKEPIKPKLMVISEIEGGLWGNFQPLN